VIFDHNLPFLYNNKVPRCTTLAHIESSTGELESSFDLKMNLQSYIITSLHCIVNLIKIEKKTDVPIEYDKLNNIL
jgi:hypothetical protein